ncbi:MAG TPA: GntR family transcriptional regulator, partial [Thermodesulfobacteriota bacterium]|nr:GntR family transcriptional regulator [Thermodesulfobacteriota bacterium]
MAHENLAGRIYESLRKDILELKMKPGQKLSEIQLARKFLVSRAPVRDAIRRLHQENFLLVKPQVGTIVMPISLLKAMDILEVRIRLEPFAAALAAPKITNEDIDLLNYYFLRLANKEALPDRKKKLYEADAIVHNTIWERCGNEEIKTILD